MKTSPIFSPTNLTSGTASATKQSGAPSDVPFSQVLSREMAARPDGKQPPRPGAAQNSKEAQATRSESKPEDASTAEQAAAESETGGAAAAADDKTAAIDAAKIKDEKADPEDISTVADAPAELLALVASLTQPASRAASDARSADTDPPSVLDTSEDGAKPHRKTPDLSLLAQSTMQEQRSIAPTMTTGHPARPLDDADALQVRGKISPQSASPTARRRVDATDRAVNAAAGEESTRSSFDAKLAQAGDGKTQPGETPAFGQSEFAATSGAEHGAAKIAHDFPQPAAIPANLNAMSAAQQAQPVPQLPPQAAEMLAPRVGTQGWDQALGQKVVWMVGSEQQSASLTLNPPDLGPLQVVLHVSENQATANFTAAQPEVRHALEAAMPKLREMLGDAGIQLGQANVSAGTPNNQQGAFSQQPQQSPRQGGDSARANDGDAVPVRASSQVIRGGQGLLDTFA